MEQLIPNGQCETEVDVLRPIQLVVDPVEVRAHKDPLQRPEAQRVLEWAKATIPP